MASGEAESPAAPGPFAGPHQGLRIASLHGGPRVGIAGRGPVRAFHRGGWRHGPEDRCDALQAGAEADMEIPLVVDREGLDAIRDRMPRSEFGVCGRPVRIDRPPALEVAPDPVEELRAEFAFGHLRREVDRSDARLAVREGVDLPDGSEPGMAQAAVAVKDDGVGVVECGRVHGMAVEIGCRMDPVETAGQGLHQQADACRMLVRSVAVALDAADEHHFPAAFHPQALEFDVAEFHGHGRSAMDLEADQARARRRRVVVDHVRHDVAVDLVDVVIAAGDHVETVPAIRADQALQLDRIAHAAGDGRLAVGADPDLFAPTGENPARPFAVEPSCVPFSGFEIGLQPAQDVGAPFARFFEAAVLDAGIARIDPVVELEFEIVDLPLPPDQERVRRNRIVGPGLADDLAVLDAPELGIAFPALERDAVEDRHETARRAGGGQSCRAAGEQNEGNGE